MRLFVKFSGLFVYAADNKTLHVFAPTTKGTSTPEHTVDLKVVDGKPLKKQTLDGHFVDIRGGGNNAVSLPAEIPSISAKYGNKLKASLFNAVPSDASLQSCIRLRGIVSMSARGGAYFVYGSDPVPRVIANEVYCDLGEVKAPLNLQIRPLAGGNPISLNIEDDPRTNTFNGVCLTISHDLRYPPTPTKTCKDYTEQQQKSEHFMALYCLFDCKANPTPIYWKCADPGSAPFICERSWVDVRGVDPVMCIGGGG